MPRPPLPRRMLPLPRLPQPRPRRSPQSLPPRSLRLPSKARHRAFSLYRRDRIGLQCLIPLEEIGVIGVRFRRNQRNAAWFTRRKYTKTDDFGVIHHGAKKHFGVSLSSNRSYLDSNDGRTAIVWTIKLT